MLAQMQRKAYFAPHFDLSLGCDEGPFWAQKWLMLEAASNDIAY